MYKARQDLGQGRTEQNETQQDKAGQERAGRERMRIQDESRVGSTNLRASLLVLLVTVAAWIQVLLTNLVSRAAVGGEEVSPAACTREVERDPRLTAGCEIAMISAASTELTGNLAHSLFGLPRSRS